jgi:hypothetical protein
MDLVSEVSWFLFLCLFNDAFNCPGYLASNDRMISVNNELEWISMEAVVSYVNCLLGCDYV